MKKTKQKILRKSKELFNNNGVSNVSVREISRVLDISHSNLIYHFKTKHTIIECLHQQMLDQALLLNQEIKNERNILKGLFKSTVIGFKIVYDYRFFMIDLNLIMRENEKLHSTMLHVEGIRFKMYDDLIIKMIEYDLMRKPIFELEYEYLIYQIRIYSDYWVSSSQVYDNGDINLILKKYVKLFLMMFYPYLTNSGKEVFDALKIEFNL